MTCITKHNTTERRWRHRMKWLVNFTKQTFFNTKKTRWHTEESHKHLPLSSQYWQCGKHRPYYQPRFAPPCSSWACKSMTTTWLPSHNTTNDVPTSPTRTATDQPGTRLCSTMTAREGSGKNKPSLLPMRVSDTDSSSLFMVVSESVSSSSVEDPVIIVSWQALITSTSVVLLGAFSGQCLYSSDNHSSTARALKVTSEKFFHLRVLVFFFRMPSVSCATDLGAWKSSSTELG